MPARLRLLNPLTDSPPVFPSSTDEDRLQPRIFITEESNQRAVESDYLYDGHITNDSFIDYSPETVRDDTMGTSNITSLAEMSSAWNSDAATALLATVQTATNLINLPSLALSPSA